jgi:hypothetical protein
MNVPMPPKWFNAHGFKMALQQDKLPLVLSLDHKILMIGSKTASLQIDRNLRGIYRVYWHISFCTGIINTHYVEGQIEIDQATIKDAFAVSTSDTHATTFAKEHDADIAIPGSYIRKGQFLNVPMPGTGSDGDPNISVFVSDEIKAAVRELIETQ